MAVYYNLAALVGARDEAEAFVAFFQNRTVPLPAGELPLVILLRDTSGGWIVGLVPEGMAYGTGGDPRLVSIESREAAARWFERELRVAPPFRAALFGAETYDAFVDTIAEELPFFQGTPGLVIDVRTHRALGAPPGTKPFGPGRRWWPRVGTP